jgi:hypothetical protein
MLGRMPHPAKDALHVRGNNSPERGTRGPDRAIREVARRQHGVIARHQLTALGLSDDEIKYRLRVGRLHPLHRAVYATGHAPLTREGRFMAAVLAAEPGAALTHRSAAQHWGLPVAGRGPVDVTVGRNRRPRRGIALHRACLPADEVMVHDGIPITTVPRTIFDMAADLRPRQLERAFNEAEALHLWDELSLLDLLDRYPGRPGGPAVRALLEARAGGAIVTRSELECRFLELVDEVGLPAPETNVVIGGPRGGLPLARRARNRGARRPRLSWDGGCLRARPRARSDPAGGGLATGTGDVAASRTESPRPGPRSAPDPPPASGYSGGMRLSSVWVPPVVAGGGVAEAAAVAPRVGASIQDAGPGDRGGGG